MNKPLKPNLIDPLLAGRIVKTLKPPTQDYWGPTRNLAQNLYHRFIKPNIYFFIFVIFIIIVLLFRYRSIKLEREYKEYDKVISNTTVLTDLREVPAGAGISTVFESRGFPLGTGINTTIPNSLGNSHFQRFPSDIGTESNNYEQSLPTSIAYGNIFNLPDSDMALLLYEQQKELLREPKIKYKGKYQIDKNNLETESKKNKKYSSRDEMTSINRSSGYVYPVYPNFPGGTLSINKKR